MIYKPGTAIKYKPGTAIQVSADQYKFNSTQDLGHLAFTRAALRAASSWSYGQQTEPVAAYVAYESSISWLASTLSSYLARPNAADLYAGN
jgi:hypothetical protein